MSAFIAPTPHRKMQSENLCGKDCIFRFSENETTSLSTHWKHTEGMSLRDGSIIFGEMLG